MRLRGTRTIVLLIVCMVMLAIVQSCSPYKHISKDGRLLGRNRVVLNSQYFDKSSFQNLIKQDANSSFLGVKWRMYFYSLSSRGEDKDVGFLSRNVFRVLGEKPVEYDKDLTNASCEQMRSFLKTKGCFNGTVSDSLKKETSCYYITSGDRFVIDTFSITSLDTSLLNVARGVMYSTPIKKGAYYDEDIFVSERTRLANQLRKMGYYDFSQDYIAYSIDTNHQSLSAKVKMTIRTRQIIDTNQDNKNITFHKYKIRNIYLYPNYTNAPQASLTSAIDTSIIYHSPTENYPLNKYYAIYSPPLGIKIKPLLRCIMFQRDSLFSPLYADMTYNALSQLKNFKYIDISYLPQISSTQITDTTTIPLDCAIKLSLAKPLTLSSSLEANFSAVTNSLVATNNSNYGMELNLNMGHKNIFHGAEILTTSLKGAIEIRSDIFKKGDSINRWSLVNAFESGIDVGLEFPRFLIPFGTKFYSMSFSPHTTINTGYNFQKRTYFERSIFNLNFGYSWNYLTKYSHVIMPLETNLVKINITSESFKDQIANLSHRIQYQFSDHLVMNSRYSFVYNGQERSKKRDFSYYRFNFETAGNLIYAINTMVASQKNSNKQYTLFGIPYAQYVRGDFDLKKYHYYSKDKVLVMRTYGGVGVPYANATALPYEKSFFSGGANNHRAWQLRGLGPGSSKQDESQLKYDRSGDISFGANVEYRFPIAGILEGATFIDVGNIWTLYKQTGLEDGWFQFDRFYKELATGGGFGLRVVTKFIIVRFDFAVRLWDPSKSMNERWVLPNTTFSDINVNFGIGYPF